MHKNTFLIIILCCISEILSREDCVTSLQLNPLHHTERKCIITLQVTLRIQCDEMAERDASPLPSETDDEYYFSSSYSVSSEASDDFCSSLDAETILPYRFEPDLSEEVDSEEVHATVDVVSTETMIASHRIGNTDW